VQAHVSRLALVPAPGRVDLHLTGPAGRYRIDGSTNMIHWTSLGEFDFAEPPVSRYIMRADNPAAPALHFRASFLP
jgi:hypothetical protein